jgi:hypothetical protein
MKVSVMGNDAFLIKDTFVLFIFSLLRHWSLFNKRAIIYSMFFHRIHRILRYYKYLKFNFVETLSTVIIYRIQRTQT